MFILFHTDSCCDTFRRHNRTHAIHLFFHPGIVIVGAKRTPFGTFGGKLSKTSACDLQTAAVKAALASAKVNPELVDTVTIGNVLSVSPPTLSGSPNHVSFFVSTGVVF